MRIPILALPGLTRAAVDAAVPGFGEPRIEALLRSLPKDARRNLIPIGETAAELERHAHAAYPRFGWQRFEIDALPDREPLTTEQGTVWVYPTLAQRPGSQSLEVRYEWSAAEARRGWRRGAAQLARRVLSAQARDIGKAIAGNASLLLAAAPYATSAALTEMLLQMVFRRACFADLDAPRTREAFDGAVDQGRAQLHACLEEIAASALLWFTEARAIRRALEDPAPKLAADAAAESREHLQRLLHADALESLSPEWLRQLPRYLKAEARRWQRAAARGVESPHIVRELRGWSQRHRSLAVELGAELRWIPELDDLQNWIEEYRVSLYAQELKTLGPISAARLEARAAEIENWIKR